MKKRHIVMLVLDAIYILTICIFTIIPISPYISFSSTDTTVTIYFPTETVYEKVYVSKTLGVSFSSIESSGTYSIPAPFSVFQKFENIKAYDNSGKTFDNFSDCAQTLSVLFGFYILEECSFNPLGILLFANLLLSAFLVPLQIIKVTKERNAKRRAIEEELRYQRFKERMEREKRR